MRRPTRIESGLPGLKYEFLFNRKGEIIQATLLILTASLWQEQPESASPDWGTCRFGPYIVGLKIE